MAAGKSICFRPASSGPINVDLHQNCVRARIARRITQKRRWIGFPVLPVLVKVFNVPLTCDAGPGTPNTVAKAEPLNFWQSAQWQTLTNAGFESALWRFKDRLPSIFSSGIIYMRVR
jgi:hypothetical protein